MAKCYMLASISSVLKHQHSAMATAAEIMQNLIEVLGGTIDPESQITIILQSLPPSFQQFKLNFEMNKRDYTLAELLTELQSAEDLMVQAKIAMLSLAPNLLSRPHFAKDSESGLGHANERRIHAMVDQDLIKGLEKEPFSKCESCLEGKMTKRPFMSKGNRAKEVLELVHTVVCGRMSTEARSGFRYFITFIDDFSKIGYVYLMRYKSETFDKFKKFKAKVETRHDWAKAQSGTSQSVGVSGSCIGKGSN
ncbi:uncharacterized protein LOC125189858 [Salvia hispanica]|uniref:uncharacterized protein LOC125189858 n=1 Tax=Salvia hispanica TaxID=49212 RepID=UPI002008FCE0|nr:uncharacterized protein LOC125189858 [Salvia hispanica]